MRAEECERLAAECVAESNRAPESLETSVAINQCLDGNPRTAIQVLERKLRGNDFTVPPRS